MGVKPPVPPPPTPPPFNDAPMRLALGEAQNEVRSLRESISEPPPKDKSLQWYADQAEMLERAERRADALDVDLRRVRGEKSATPRTDLFSSQALKNVVTQIETAQQELRASEKDLQDIQKDLPVLENELKRIGDIVRFGGCACVLDKARGECRLDSVETGKFRAKIDYLATCREDCARWYARPDIRDHCASQSFLDRQLSEWTEKKRNYDSLIARQSETLKKANQFTDTVAEKVKELDAIRGGIAGEIFPTEMARPVLPAAHSPLEFAVPKIPIKQPAPVYYR